jgi:hypothetical protein
MQSIRMCKERGTVELGRLDRMQESAPTSFAKLRRRHTAGHGAPQVLSHKKMLVGAGAGGLTYSETTKTVILRPYRSAHDQLSV